MALSLRTGQQPISTGNTSVTFGLTANSGNLLVVFINQLTSLLAPTLTGYTVNATDASFGATLVDSLYVAYKISNGTETSATPTAGVGGTVNAVAYAEITGGPSTTVDTIVATALTGTMTTITSPSYTTTNAGSIIVAGFGTQAATGTVSAWSGTPTPIGFSTASTRLGVATVVPGSTVTGATATAGWTTARQAGLIVIAFTPLAISGANSQMLSMGVG